MLYVLLGVPLGVLGVGLIVGYFGFSAPIWNGPTSDHFDGRRFLNKVPAPHAGFGSVLKWMVTAKRGPWERRIDATPGPKPPERVSGGDMRVTFVNHATLLVQFDGLNVLFDPIWSERASPLSFVGPRRMRPPGIRFEDLPPIDAVLISHNHYDHLDVPTLKRLALSHNPRIFAGLGNRAFLESQGLTNVRDLDWHERVELSPEVGVVAVPVQHFSGRGLADRDGTLWTGYVIQAPSGPVYFAGDTGWGAHFLETRERYGRPRLALIPIGAFLPRWFMGHVHIDPEQAVQVHEVMEAGTSVAMHYGTFPLADDGENEPLEELERVLSSREERPEFWVLGFGEGRDVPPLALDEDTGSERPAEAELQDAETAPVDVRAPVP